MIFSPYRKDGCLALGIAWFIVIAFVLFGLAGSAGNPKCRGYVTLHPGRVKAHLKIQALETPQCRQKTDPSAKWLTTSKQQ